MLAHGPEGLSDAGKQDLEGEGYEPGADFGEGEAEPRGNEAHSRQADDIPGWEEDATAGIRDAGADKREAGEDTRANE